MAIRHVLIGLVMAWMAVACTNTTPEPSATLQPTPIAVQATATFTADESEPITSPENLDGVWHSVKGGLYILFRADGYFAISTTRDEVQTAPGVQGEFSFDDDALVMHHLELVEPWLPTFEEAIGSTNTFSAFALPDGTIRFDAMSAEFEFVANAMAGEGGVKVYYSRVD